MEDWNRLAPPLVLLLLCSCALESPTAKPLPEQFEVQMDVRVLDEGDLSPLAGARVVVHGNGSLLASGQVGDGGAVGVSFAYRAGTRVVITASRQDYVTNSLAWSAGRRPLFSSVSLYLLAQRPGTLILYDDVLHVFSGSPGAGQRPLVELQRKSLRLPPASDQTVALSAALTEARTQSELNGFPFLLGQDASGVETGWAELTALAAVSVRLLDGDGADLHPSDTIRLTIPLPHDTQHHTATSVPTWWYQNTTGLWLRNGTGYIEKDSAGLVWTAAVPQTGCWLAAFPSSSGVGSSAPGRLRDVSSYHALFLLSILGSLALLLLILLCALLYYCRRRCLKPRRQRGRPRPFHPNGARRDQGTSTSRLDLVCGGRCDSGPSDDKSDPSFRGPREDPAKHPPSRSPRRPEGRNGAGSQRGESFPMKATRATETNNLDHPPPRDDYGPMEAREPDYHRHDNRGYSPDPPSPPRFQGYMPSQSDKPPEYSVAADGMGRPTSLNTQPGQIIFCSSVEQMKEKMYRSMVPTLVIPAHYMRLPPDFKEGTDAAKERDNDSGLTGGGPQKHGPQQQHGGARGHDTEGPTWSCDTSGGPVTFPVLFDDSTMAQMNGELQALTEKKLLELGVKQHPRAWFISLDGRANAHVRHSYIDPGNDLSGSGFVGGFGGSGGLKRDIHLETPLESQERKAGVGRTGKDERWGTGGRRDHGGGGKTYSPLAYPDHSEPSSSEGRPVSPEENSLTPLLDEGPSSRGCTIPRRGRGGEKRRDSATSPEDDPDDKDENRKSPWQKIEDRPLMVFHPRK